MRRTSANVVWSDSGHTILKREIGGRWRTLRRPVVTQDELTDEDRAMVADPRKFWTDHRVHDLPIESNR